MKEISLQYGARPDTKTQAVTVVTLADNRYAMPLAVMVRSVLDSLGAERRLSLIVIDGGLSNESKQRLFASWQPHQLTTTWISPKFRDVRELPVWGRVPALTYARIFIADFVPPEVKKVLLLDSDVLVLADLGRLWDLTLDGSHLLAVQDAFVPSVSARDGLADYDALGIRHGTTYFNAGLMVIDVARWREDDVAGKAISYIATHSSKLRNYDQDALNAVLFDKWRPLDDRWQVQPRLVEHSRIAAKQRMGLAARSVEEAWALHFSGRLKPWVYRRRGPADRLFYQYLDRTAWRGWRPEFSLRGLAYRLYDSRVRDWFYPMERRCLGVLRDVTRRMETISNSNHPPGGRTNDE